MATGELETNDHILDGITRHCILHALTVIEAAIFKESSSILDDFVKELTNLVYPKRKSSSAAQSDILLIPPLEADQFYENAITAQEFAIKIEARISEAIKQSIKKIDIEDIHMMCWKYYSTEKKKALSFPKWLSPTCTYRLFIIFNQLLGVEMTVQISEQKLNYLLERIVLSCGFQSQAILKVIRNSHKPGIAFPEFLEEITNTFEFLKLEMSLTCEMILDLLDEIVMGVLKKGYLTKRGGNRKNWKRRWFILKESTLFYYESRENLTQKGGMVLNKATDVISLPDEKGKLYRFVVTCGVKGRAFEIKASDQRTKSEWIHAIKEAISLGRLKRNDLEDDTDPCEMAAHYRLKYGIDKDQFSQSLPNPGRDNSGPFHTKVGVPVIQELNSDSDSEQPSVAIPKRSPNNARRTKSYEPQSDNPFPKVDFRWQTPREGHKSKLQFRHSSYLPPPQSKYNQSNFSEEHGTGSGYVKSTSSPLLQRQDSYEYMRQSIAITEDVTEVYVTSPRTQQHQFKDLKPPVEADEYYIPPSNQALQNDSNVTSEIYEAMNFTDEDAPPLPVRKCKPTCTDSNKHVDSNGYLKILPNHVEIAITTVGASDSISSRERMSAKGPTGSDCPELTDSAQ